MYLCQWTLRSTHFDVVKRSISWSTNTVTSLEPVSSEYGMVTSGRRERNRNSRAAIDFNAAKASGGLLESKRREIKEAANLVLCLKKVSEILAWQDWTVCAIDSVLPRPPPVLQPIPGEKPTGT